MLRADRLLASELVAIGTPEQCWAAVLLWCRAWQQKPAASLPNDDRVLASFSRAGRRWPKVKDMAMRGFVLCNDDRWYHKVLAREALEAWDKRVKFRDRSQKAHTARQGLQQADLLDATSAQQEGKGSRSGSGSGRDFKLPDWVPAEPWQHFVEMRQRIRKPMTPRAQELAVEDLQKLVSAGQDATKVLEQSVKNSWLGLFPVRAPGGAAPSRQAGLEQGNAAAARDWAGTK